MNISVFGLGYVGAVSVACLARDGHSVIGVDVDAAKVEKIAGGVSPIVEPGLDELLAQGVREGRIRATTDFAKAVEWTEITLVSVGTPPTSEGKPDLRFVRTVSRQIGEAIARKGTPHLVVLRSTVPPGTLAECRRIMAEIAGDHLVLAAFNPEFLRESTAIRDYDNPPYTIIGTDDPQAEEMLRKLYAGIDAPLIVTRPQVAEMVKYAANTWHAVKIGFANEIGRLAKAFGVDGRDVMDLLVQDTKLNISPAYMKPGFAYGGSCLPKDLGSLLYHARELNVPVPVLSALPVSNDIQIEIAAQEAARIGARKVAVLGLAFKPGTDDLRESPAVRLIKKLLGEGFDIKVYDKAVHQARLLGTNLAYLRTNLPHFERLLTATPEEALAGADAAIVTYNDRTFTDALQAAGPGLFVLDLAGLYKEPPGGMAYHGIAW